MAGTMTNGGRNAIRLAGWGLAAALILAPLIAMQFTREVNWTASDFLFAALLVGGVGVAFEFVVRRSQSKAYRGGAAAALAGVFLTIWANAAVGMIGSEDNAYNLLFGGVILIALIGSGLARFRAKGMAVAMGVAAAAQAAASIGGMPADMRGGILSLAFALIWLLSAWLFARSSRLG